MPQTMELKKKVETFRELIENRRNAIEALLPAHMNSDRFLYVALMAVSRMPKLLDCTKASVLGSLIECATMGLEPFVAGNCWIIPYKEKATVIWGYRGLIQLARRSGSIDDIKAAVVFENDEFDLQDFPPLLNHKREINVSDSERGEPIGVYAAARFINGHWQHEFLDRLTVEKIKNRSQAAAKPESPWNHPEDWKWMWKKTAYKQLDKTLPHSIEEHNLLERALELDNKAEVGLDQGLEEVGKKLIEAPIEEPEKEGKGEGKPSV